MRVYKQSYDVHWLCLNDARWGIGIIPLENIIDSAIVSCNSDALWELNSVGASCGSQVIFIMYAKAHS